MAGHAAKKAAQREQGAGAIWDKVLLGVNVVYILLRVLWNWSSFTKWTAMGYLFLLAVSYACKAMVVMAAADARQGEYFLDVLVISLVVQLGTIYSDNFWYLFLLVPAYAGYRAVRRLLDWVFTPTAAEVEEEQEAHDPKASRRARRYENKMRKYG